MSRAISRHRLQIGATALVNGRLRQTVTLFGFVLIVSAERHDARLCRRGY
jgi:hypothetical protein